MSEKIGELRKLTGLNRKEFAKFYEIPLRTVEDWELGKSNCPPYVEKFLERIVNEDVAAGKFKKSPAEG